MESTITERTTSSKTSSDGAVKMDTSPELSNGNPNEAKHGVSDGNQRREKRAACSDEPQISVKIPALDKYNLRTKSIQNRIEIEKKRRNPRREPKPKQRPPPLSKYRRRTANARERTRMQEINDAFEELKRVVPNLPSDEIPATASSEKLTKITTLRLAVNYIAALTQILKQTDDDSIENQNQNQNDNQGNSNKSQEKEMEIIHRHLDSNNNLNNIACDNQNLKNTIPSQITTPVSLVANDNDNINSNHNIPQTMTETTLFDCGDFLATNDFVAAEIENLLRLHRPSSCSSSDLPSCSSPSTATDTESLGSLKSATWDFGADETLDVPNTFDLILESDESMHLSDDHLI